MPFANLYGDNMDLLKYQVSDGEDYSATVRGT